MSTNIQRSQKPEDLELEEKQRELQRLESLFAEKELELATRQAELHLFELRYMRQVGCLYAVLDDLEARIAESIALQHPTNERARRVAEAARIKADQSAAESSQSDRSDPLATQFKPSEELKGLYRSAAKAMHPDLALNETDHTRRHEAMAAINQAYERGDESRLRAIIDEWMTSPESVTGEGTAAELVRVIRRIALIRRRLAVVDGEIELVQSSSLAHLKRTVDEGLNQGRDILQEMEAQVRTEIEDAKSRLGRLC